MTSTLERLNERRKQDEGFTLIELLVVIVILGILAGVVIFAVNGIQDKGQTSACKADRNAIEVAAEAFYAQTNNGSYPADMDAMVPEYLKTTPTLHTYTGVDAGSDGVYENYTIADVAPCP